MNRNRIRMALAVLLALGGVGCNSGGISENNYVCTGYCNGEPLPQTIIQAPDPKTACTEFLEICRGSGVCISCS